MTDEEEPPDTAEEADKAEKAEETLAELARIRRRGRVRAHGGAWLAAGTFALLVLASALLYRYPFSDPPPFGGLGYRIPSWAGLPAEQTSAAAAYAYWFVGTPLAFALLALWYRWRERRTGVKVAWPWIIGIGLGVLALLAVLAAVPVEPPPPDSTEVSPVPMAWPWRSILTPLLPVAAAVVALGWVERSRWLIAAGCWLAAVAVWHCSQGMGGLPGWATWVLGGFQGPAAGGQLTLLGLHRPGPVLILAALPLVVYVGRHAWKSRRAAP